ncbi:ATP-binding protein [Psychroserpens sp. AS72]|uniref:ATP-binding protein n=1 Tax=Psychroserpens sp. AS72 TaxID=3135775 RepID=UPI00316DF095
MTKLFHNSVLIIILFFLGIAHGQDSLYVLKASDIDKNGYYKIPELTEWEFKKGNDASWAKSDINDKSWTKLDSTAISKFKYDDDGYFEAWFRIKLKMDTTLTKQPFFLTAYSTAAQEIYLDGNYVGSFGKSKANRSDYQGNFIPDFVYLQMQLGKTHQVTIHFLAKSPPLKWKDSDDSILENSRYYFTDAVTSNSFVKDFIQAETMLFLTVFIIGVFIIFISIVTFLNPAEKHLKYILVYTLIIWISVSALLVISTSSNLILRAIADFVYTHIFGTVPIILLPLLCAQVFYDRIPRWVKISTIALFGLYVLGYFIDPESIFLLYIIIAISVFCGFVIIYKTRKTITTPKWAIAIGVFGAPLILFLALLLGAFEIIDGYNFANFYVIAFMFLPFCLMLYIILWLRESVSNEKEKSKKVIALTEEKKKFLQDQNEKLELKVTERTTELNQSIEELKATQSQLIQSEKMASLGELTAGIAHEIQNPLNFVNNFSEVSSELIDEMHEELDKGDMEEVKAISNDIKQNLEKINHHGKRADDIVKGMLQHSRTSGNKKEPTDINDLADEYLRLAYHGLRAKDKSFNATLETDFDDSIGKIEVIPQDMGRVILNLITNAFYAVNEKKQTSKNSEYKPTVSVSTKKENDQIIISVKDNGNGIPISVKEKIFQPFFTTKPTGQGTGLGLSMSYDIVTKGHGGELKVETKEGEGTLFLIQLPINE